MLSYSYYSTAFFNFKAKDGFFTKNSVYARTNYARTKNRAQHFSMHPAEAAVSSTVFKLISMSVNSSPEV